MASIPTSIPIPTPAPVSGQIDWFLQARFGMFIHWGLYALPGRHEWVKSREGLTDEKYDRYLPYFDPDLYQPEEWAQRAKDAGMKYFVITTKHHDGFCMWDSKHTEYKVTNTPAGRDLLRPMVKAFRDKGLKVGFYHSLIDWHHPHFPIDRLHPLYKHMTREEVIEANKSRDVAIYRQYLHNQVRELLTDFGEISYIFFDFSYPQPDAAGLPGKGCQDWGSEELDKLVRDLQPQILINDRLNLPLDRPDVHTPEQMQPRAWVEKEGRPVFWETCQTFSGAWGYFRDETTWKSPGQLIRMLINTVACGGNLLMNVGPTARGTFDHRAQQALQIYADWMALHSRSIYGCTMSNFTAPADCRLTQNGKRLYLHVYAWPFKHLHLENLGDQVEYAQLLNDASEIAFTIDQTSNCLTLQLPVIQPEVTVPVIELFLK